ncbi:MAG TPA: nucleotidyltransferase domain-containing protein [Spirochaetota bacterium]|nr:nucleotidyltransferase domain-containing protein [Spirochaetota bacterium]
MSNLSASIPSHFKEDLETAISILRKYGVTEIYIFGSLADGTYNENSDIDIAVKGLKPELFLKAYSDLSFNVNKKVDLLNMDTQERFAGMLDDLKELIRVA